MPPRRRTRAAAATATAAATTTPKRTLDARPDTLDFRDRMYVPTLIEVPPRRLLADYLAEYPKGKRPPILDQGVEGACTGFGLAAVANYLLQRRRVAPSTVLVSPRMLYEMAKRYDEWPGEQYEGSSARGAMKGWHKHGVCQKDCWEYDQKTQKPEPYKSRWTDALNRPLGAYFRVNHRDLVAMHSAISEVGILYATATVHEGWDEVGANGVISYDRSKKILGGHAFAIVAYEERGFWVQNSWGPSWGNNGFCLVSYDDWLANGTDVWVARLGAPVAGLSARSTAVAITSSAKGSRSYAFCDLRPHIITIGNNGQLNTSGEYGTSESDVRAIFEDDFPRITKDWKQKKILLYAHGGLVAEESAIQRLADLRADLLANQIFPVSFIWRTDFWSTLQNVLQDSLKRRRPEGALDSAKDFMLDRLDDALEPIARALSGKLQWDEMKENALLATKSGSGGARIAAGYLDQLLKREPKVELHIAGHSAGSIFHAPLVQLLTGGALINGPLEGAQGLGRTIASCTLWAPACTVELFKSTYLPAIHAGKIDRFSLFTLTDETERDDSCANIYNKSLLYLVSNAFEAKCRIPGFPPFARDGVPILGMEKFVNGDNTLKRLFHPNENAQWVKSPNTFDIGSPNAARAQHHGDFDDDKATLQSTLARMLNKRAPKTSFSVQHRSEAGSQARRAGLSEAQRR
jgi:hypothetical protein